MTFIPPDQSHLWTNIREELDKLKAENAALKTEVNALKHNSTIEIDPELAQAISEFDANSITDSEKQTKKELNNLLNDLEEMIISLNVSTGMGLKVPDKLKQIRNSLST